MSGSGAWSGAGCVLLDAGVLGASSGKTQSTIALLTAAAAIRPASPRLHSVMARARAREPPTSSPQTPIFGAAWVLFLRDSRFCTTQS